MKKNFKWKYSNVDFDVHLDQMRWRAKALRIDAGDLIKKAEAIDNEINELERNLEEVRDETPTP